MWHAGADTVQCFRGPAGIRKSPAITRVSADKKPPGVFVCLLSSHGREIRQVLSHCQSFLICFMHVGPWVSGSGIADVETARQFLEVNKGVTAGCSLLSLYPIIAFDTNSWLWTGQFVYQLFPFVLPCEYR